MAGPQTQVNFVRALGVPGEMAYDGPHRVQAAILESASAAYNIIGATAYTVKTAASDGDPNAPIVAQAGHGDTAIFAGVLVDPKQYASFGGSGGPLTPTMALANEVNAFLTIMGEWFVTVPAACNVGDKFVFDNTTGALSTIVPNGSPSGSQTLVPNAIVWKYAPTGAGLAVMKITN